MLRLPLSIVSPAGSRGRLSILIFHRVLKAPDPLRVDEPDAAQFEARMRWVRDWFNVLPLAPAIQMLYAGTLPSRALAITFDDGYADNEELAAPILNRLGLTATFFISTGYLDGGCMWNDRVIEAVRTSELRELDATSIGLGPIEIGSPEQRRAAIATLLKGIKHFDQARREEAARAVVKAAGDRPPPALMMRRDQVIRMRSLGMDIGAHTVTHPILARLQPEAALVEMARSKSELESMIGSPVELFAYPNGVPQQDYAAEHVAMARDIGFSAAVSTSWASASARSDRYQLPRFTPWDRTRLRYGARLLDNYRRRETVAASN